MKRASYREAIQWIAYNDDISGILDKDGPFATVTTCLIADIFDTTTERVTKDVANAFRKMDEAREREANHVDGYDRDDLGESPDY